MAPGRGLLRPRRFGVSAKGVPRSRCDPISISSPPGVAMDAIGETPPSERRRCDRCPAAAEGGGGGGGGIRDDGGGSGSGGGSMCESMPISDASSCDRGRLVVSPLGSSVLTNTDGTGAPAPSERRQPRLSRLDEGHVGVVFRRLR